MIYEKIKAKYRHPVTGQAMNLQGMGSSPQDPPVPPVSPDPLVSPMPVGARPFHADSQSSPVPQQLSSEATLMAKDQGTKLKLGFITDSVSEEDEAPAVEAKRLQ